MIGYKADTRKPPRCIADCCSNRSESDSWRASRSVCLQQLFGMWSTAYLFVSFVHAGPKILVGIIEIAAAPTFAMQSVLSVGKPGQVPWGPWLAMIAAIAIYAAVIYGLSLLMVRKHQRRSA